MTTRDPLTRPRRTGRTVEELARASVIVLDSWHLLDGTGVAIGRHRARFTCAVAEVFGVGTDVSAAAYDAALAQLPRTGGWFPAFVWTPDGLHMCVRPFPVEHLRTTACLAADPLRDARKRPQLKGFDYLWQSASRRTVGADEYDDGILVTDDGLISETIFATPVVWRDGELLVPTAPRLPSITLSVLRERAAAADLSVREQPLTLDDLVDADSVLTLSSLHGVRWVHQLGQRQLPGDPAVRDRLHAVVETARCRLAAGGRPCASC